MVMRNFENALRLYNKRVLNKTKMHTYTKKYIDNLMKNCCMFDGFEVSLIKLTEEDIENYKLRLIKNKDNIPQKEGIEDGSAEKKQKLDTNGIVVLKSVLSTESETRTLESQLSSSLKPVKEIASTSIEEVPTVIDCDESTKSENSSVKKVWPRINVIDARKMMEKDKYINWMNTLGIKPKRITNDKTNLAVAKPSTSKLNPSSHSTKVNELKYPLNAKNHVRGNLIDIEKIFKKYFGKSVLDTVIIIANIVNLIAISNKHLKERMDASLKKISEAEKLKERCNANRLHEMHKTILETKLKTNFVCVISSFAESEFDLAFKMLFLSILTVFRVLDHPTYGKCSNFHKLLITLSTSLKNSEYNHPKMFSMFRSKNFRHHCIEIISIIEDCRDSDPGIVFRMPLFFISSVDNQRYFQAATDTVTGKLNEKLELVIEQAILQCSIHSYFKNFEDSPTVEHSNYKLPVPETIQSPINSDIITEQPFRFKNQNQLKPVLNGNKGQTIGNAKVKPSIVTTQPLSNFYDPISSSLQKKKSASSSSTMIPTKKYSVDTPINSNSPLYLHQTASSSSTATPVPSKRSKRKLLTPNTSIQNIKTEPNSSPQITQDDKNCSVDTPINSNSPLNLHQTASSSSTATPVPSKRSKRNLLTPNTSIQNIKTEPNSYPQITQDDKNYSVDTPINSNSPLYLHQTASSSSTATPVPSKRKFLTRNTSIRNIKTEPNSSPQITQDDKKYTFVTPINSNRPLYLHQTASSSNTATPVPSKRTFLTPNASIQNIKTEPNSSSQITQGNNIIINKKIYKIVNLPRSRMRALDTSTNLHGKQPSTNIIKCSMEKCKNSATIMCGNCKIVKYCTLSCQHLHWALVHAFECDDMIRLSQNHC